MSSPVRQSTGRISNVRVAAGLFAFGGWHMVTYAAGETVEARRTIPIALMLWTAIVTATLRSTLFICACCLSMP